MSNRTIVSRRTVAAGMAWAVPAVMLVAQTPAYAASGDIVRVLDSSVACKLTGGTKRYQFTLVFESTGTTQTTLCVTAGQMFTNGAQCEDPAVTGLPFCTTVAAGTTVSLKFLSVPAECLSNGYMTLSYTYTLVGGTTVAVTTTVPFNSVSPC